MNLAYVTLLIFLVVYALIYYSSIKPALSCAQKPKNTAALFWLLAAFCLVLRLITASFIEGFSTDITCFKSWSQMVYTDGFSNFYSSSSLTDYPPGYMYVLYVIGFLRNLFSLDYNSASFTVLIKLPAIICDILAGFLIYKISSKNDRARAFSLSLAAIYLLNPAVIINSSAWGQVSIELNVDDESKKRIAKFQEAQTAGSNPSMLYAMDRMSINNARETAAGNSAGAMAGFMGMGMAGGMMGQAMDPTMYNQQMQANMAQQQAAAPAPAPAAAPADGWTDQHRQVLPGLRQT